MSNARWCSRISPRHLFALLIAAGLFLHIHNVQAQEDGRSPFKWPDGKRAAVSLSFDDARLSQIDKGIPLLNKYDVKATFYVMEKNLTARLEGWKKAVDNGHEIGNHTQTHPCTGNYAFSRSNALEKFTADMMKDELDGANDAIERLLGVRPATFAYPCGQTYIGQGKETMSYVPLVAERFLVGRKYLSESANDPVVCDLSQVMGVGCDELDFEQIKTLIDKAAEEGRWLIFAGHEIGDTGFQTTRVEALESLCRYAADPANGIWIDTVQAVGGYVAARRGERNPAEKPVYRDSRYTIEQRVEDLLGRMTLEEKIGQINMPCVYVGSLGKEIEDKFDGCRKFTEGYVEEGVGPGGGFFTLSNTILHEGPRQQAEFFNELQTIALEKTRLGIPLIEVEEGTHGFMCSGGTMFPEGLALGSTWNMDLIGDIYTVAAKEARAAGVHQLFTLVVEPYRDPRLGRNQEGYSEDQYLCSRMAEEIVNAVQGGDISAPDKVIAGLCHYPGQSQPVSGLERGALEISERILRQDFLPPWVAGIKKCGALGVMATYPAIDGVPVHGSKLILTKILREEMGFEGLVLGEGGGISTLIYEGLAPTQKEAGELAIKAGVDVGISYEAAYMMPMIENVREGKVSMETIDRAVRRILTIKYRLGLFEDPFVDPDHAVAVSNTAEHQALALQAAREGVVLLKNENDILPLDKNIKSIAVIGPNADNMNNQLGDYTADVVLQDVVTILDGIRNKVSEKTKVSYVKGCDVIGTKTNSIKEAVKAAKNAEAVIVVLGENEWQAPDNTGTSGEGFDVASLDLTGLQQELIEVVHATGTPTIVVLINGRPLSIRWIAENIPAILEPWCCGEQGGNAVAEVIFGDYNPSGRLPVTVPRHVGQIPVYYNHKKSKSYWIERGWGTPYSDMSPKPLFEFGYGLSYTKFEYSNLKISSPQIGRDGSVDVSLDVKNTGDRAGSEVVQLYIKDVISSLSTPEKELKGFEKAMLDAGEKKSVTFTLTPEHLSFINSHLETVVEPGDFEVMVGHSSEDIRLRGGFAVTK